MHNRLTIFLASLFFCTPSFSISNIENERLAPIKEGFSGQLQANIEGKSGNTDEKSFDIGAKGILKSGTRMLLLVASREYGKSFNQTNADNNFIHLRFVKEHNSRFSSEYFVQNQSNPFKRLTERSLIGLGGRFNLHNEKNLNIIVGAGAFFLREEVFSEEIKEFWRGNIYFINKYKLNEQINFLNTLYLQPRMNDFNDIEGLNDLSLNVKLSSAIKLKLGVKTTHDRKPPSGVAKTDQTYSTSIVFSF